MLRNLLQAFGRSKSDHFSWVARSLILAISVAGVTDQALAKEKPVPIYPVTESAEISSFRPILLLPPKIRHDSYKVGKQERDVELDEESVERWIHGVETHALREMGATLLDAERLLSDGQLMGELLSMSESVVRGRDLPGEFPRVLKEISDVHPGVQVLLQHLQIKIAPLGKRSLFGIRAMTVEMSNSNLRGIMFDSLTGEVLWRGEMYIRMIPEVGDSGFEAAVVGMFSNLTVLTAVEGHDGQND